MNDPDFIEVEIPQSHQTFAGLLGIGCDELGIRRQDVQRIRKLPNTIVRKDKDVKRLMDFQEVEYVLAPGTRTPNGVVQVTQMAAYQDPGVAANSSFINAKILY